MKPVYNRAEPPEVINTHARARKHTPKRVRVHAAPVSRILTVNEAVNEIVTDVC